MNKLKPPFLKSAFRDRHPTTLLSYDEDDNAIEICGDSWCSGECGLPAAVIPGEPELRLFGAMTACGPVMLTAKSGPYDPEVRAAERSRRFGSQRSFERGLQQGQAEERAAVVKYLRSEASRWDDGTLAAVANLIEDDYHHRFESSDADERGGGDE